MNIQALRTGSMSIKESYYAAKGRTRVLRLASVMLDPKFRVVPVYTWAIEHPEGVIVIDTGMSALMANYEYFPRMQHPYWKSQYRFHITEDEEIGPQLEARGIKPRDVRRLIVTHSHFDHTGGLDYFSNSEVLFSRKDYQDTQLFRSARFAFPAQWPKWLPDRLTLIDFDDRPLGPFTQSHSLTQLGDVHLVPTPGHTMGHMSVVLRTAETTYFFAADASFDLPSLLNGTLDAPAYNSEVTLETRNTILEYARTTPLVYLSTHDPETEKRLLNRTPVYDSAGQPVVSDGLTASIDTQSPSVRTPVTR